MQQLFTLVLTFSRMVARVVMFWLRDIASLQPALLRPLMQNERPDTRIMRW
jgi:hypothetical protein